MPRSENDYVSEMVDIDEDSLFERATSDNANSFWIESNKFYGQVKDRRWLSLSDSQRSWLEKIERAMDRL